MIKAIIFDCFGVLAEDGWKPFKRKYIEPHPELVQQVADLGRSGDRGFLGHDEMVREISRLANVDEEVLQQSLNRRVPNEELLEFIQTELKPEYKVGFMSNANYNVLESIFTPQQAGLFDASVMSYESHLVKPDPRMFELMVERLGVGMGECIFIDDNEPYVEAAEDLGMQAVFYQEPESCKRKIREIIKND